MADIFEEVEEGIRQERLTKAWKKYGIFAYLAAGLLIGGVALNEYLQDSRSTAIVENTQILESALIALDAGEYQESGATLTDLAGSGAALAPIAGHYLAKVRLDGNGDAVAAAEALASAAALSEGPAAKLALLKSAYLEADGLSRVDLEAKLAPLRLEDTAFSALALELIAAKALEEGDVEFARSEFTYLRLAPNVPSGVTKRANQALAAMPPVSLDGLNDIDTNEIETPAEPAPVEETGE